MLRQGWSVTRQLGDKHVRITSSIMAWIPPPQDQSSSKRSSDAGRHWMSQRQFTTTTTTGWVPPQSRNTVMSLGTTTNQTASGVSLPSDTVASTTAPPTTSQVESLDMAVSKGLLLVDTLRFASAKEPVFRLPEPAQVSSIDDQVKQAESVTNSLLQLTEQTTALNNEMAHASRDDSKRGLVTSLHHIFLTVLQHDLNLAQRLEEASPADSSQSLSHKETVLDCLLRLTDQARKLTVPIPVPLYLSMATLVGQWYCPPEDETSGVTSSYMNPDHTREGIRRSSQRHSITSKQTLLTSSPVPRVLQIATWVQIDWGNTSIASLEDLYSPALISLTQQEQWREVADLLGALLLECNDDEEPQMQYMSSQLTKELLFHLKRHLPEVLSWESPLPTTGSYQREGYGNPIKVGSCTKNNKNLQWIRNQQNNRNQRRSKYGAVWRQRQQRLDDLMEIVVLMEPSIWNIFGLEYEKSTTGQDGKGANLREAIEVLIMSYEEAQAKSSSPWGNLEGLESSVDSDGGVTLEFNATVEEMAGMLMENDEFRNLFDVFDESSDEDDDETEDKPTATDDAESEQADANSGRLYDITISQLGDKSVVELSGGELPDSSEDDWNMVYTRDLVPREIPDIVQQLLGDKPRKELKHSKDFEKHVLDEFSCRG